MEEQVIQAKLKVPDLPQGVVQRPRLQRLLAELIEHRRVAVVSATPGAGKTTAVVSAVSRLDRPVAWLTIDRTDAAPGRLVTYLEAALARCIPRLAGTATSALSAGVPHAEAAGLLADAIGDEPVVLVLDELERLGDERDAWAVVEALLRYAPASTSIVFVSRRDVPARLCALPPGAAIASLSDEELAFTPEEAAAALAAVGKAGIDAAAAVQATGGWVTGVLFEAWRSAGHVSGGGGEGDPLYGYLSAHILGQLDPGDSEFLITTSLLDDVTAPRAEALGLRRAGERLVALRAAHLPVSWDADGRTMHCHSRFREYLLERLERRGDEELRALRLAHARQLAAEGLHEEATEAFLRAGDRQGALPCAERAIMPAVERADFAVAKRWLDALADVAPLGSSLLTVAELMVAVGHEDPHRVVRIADQLAELGERERLAASSEMAAWMMSYGYIATVRPDDVRAVLAAAPDGPVRQAAVYAAQVILDWPARVPRPPLTGGPVDAFVSMADYALGRFDELTEPSGSGWLDAVRRQWRIAALRATGHTQAALELYEGALAAGASTSLAAWIGPEVFIDAGRGEEARRLLAHGRRTVSDAGSAAINRIVAAKLALRIDHDPAAARATLEDPWFVGVAARSTWIGEVADTWYGHALLLQGEHSAARERLRAAVADMTAGGRILELPTAAVYLAEAEWRAGGDDAADHAADVALDAARRQGSNHVLLQALADFPAVASRRIDAEAGADSAWHEIGRALVAQGVALTTAVKASVELHEFGRRSILVDGVEVKPRIAKTYELLAFLVARTPPQGRRDELLEALFDARADDSAGAYLRQAIHWLRQVLPDGAILVENGCVRLSDQLSISAESAQFATRLAEAARLQGADRVAATSEALAIFDQGEYLPGRRCGWADSRQQELADLATTARYEAAELSFAAERYEEAQELASQVLAADPFREPAWRLLMRISDTLGDEQGVVRAFRDCERTLAQLGTSPSPTTRHLLERLRR